MASGPAADVAGRARPSRAAPPDPHSGGHVHPRTRPGHPLAETTRTGAAAKAGHDLLIHVTSWEATLEVGEDPAATRIALDADGASLRVREGTGGMQALGEDDRANIEKTIDDEILKRGAVTFRSTGAEAGPDGRIRVRGDLALVGATQPIEVDLGMSGDGTVVPRPWSRRAAGG